MNNKQTIIDAYFKILKLDNRASQTELELAYDVLTKDSNLSNSELQLYRTAFEYLMCNFYKAVDIEEECTDSDDKEMAFYDTAIECIPENINSALDKFEELSDIELNNKLKTIFATQIVCLPMFFNSIMENCTKFLWFKFWSKNNMYKILKDTVFCNLKYTLICVELSCDISELHKRNDIISFMTSLKKSFCDRHNKKSLCPKFTVEKTTSGCMSMVLIENSFSEHLKKLIYNKSKILDCNCSMTTEVQN